MCRYDGLRKNEIEVALDDYLTENAARFAGDTRLAPFYKRRGDNSPIKKEAPSMTTDIIKSVKRRVTRAAEDFTAT